ncbi:putative fatty acyl-CoA reductase CG5065 [Pieris rapae]|uniref:putative fatty acyl-CoA reductase CG5065 n=1 Tax=Pieris rapae TaxID=64459 RepID=UPI001E27AC9D|nr:putative fatty acyl-CoA reductase CG5065 [Pieris rapae]XP_045485743.1 putative fatty acyl-CoA reductase CG5065 [Pieris rapae]
MFRSIRSVVNSARHGSRQYMGSGLLDTKYQRVSDYYAGKSVFVTGATGFVGKVFIERLLSNCKDIENVFVLIRPKRGADTGKRLQKIFDVPLFDKLKQTRPGDLKKVIPIEGDITTSQLGLKPDDKETLADKVSVVFHSAATVRFIDKFQDMMNINVEGTQRVIDLSRSIKHLEKFVYISTAYSNSHMKLIDEKLYTPTKELSAVRQMIRDHGTDDKKVNEYVADVANTYTLSKGLCEELVRQNKEYLPTIVVRPSIVTPMYREPLPGWVDSWVAATAVFSNVSRGLNPYIYSSEDVVCDLIPVDYVANLIIIAGAKGEISDDVSVYNINSSSENPITWKSSSNSYLEQSKRLGYCKKNMREMKVSKSKFVVNTMTFILQTVPCFFADVGLILRGKKPRHLKESSRSSVLRDIIKPFTSTSWLIKSKKTQALISSLDDHDKKLFPCDVNNIDWKEYSAIFCRGVQEFLLK